jgi:hypothetical protein
VRIDVLAKRWGSPAGAPDGMAMAASFLAWTLCELGHDVRGYLATPQGPPWVHPRVQWCVRPQLDRPDDWSADLVITTIAGVWRRTAAAAGAAGATRRLVYWHHFGGLPEGFGCSLAAPPAIERVGAWRRTLVLPPSSWAVEAGGPAPGGEIVVPGAGRPKGGHIALEVARACPELRWLVLPGRSGPSDVAPWCQLPNAEVAGPLEPGAFLARARAVLSPTFAEVHPLTLVEAAVRGIPIVCSDLPGTRAAAHCATFLPVSAPAAAWAAALRGALARPAPRLCLPPYAEVVATAVDHMRTP